MIFRTSNSTYEVSDTTKQIRRLSGNADATDRFTPNGEWKTYEDITEISMFRTVVISWPEDPTGKLRRFTYTSHVTHEDYTPAAAS